MCQLLEKAREAQGNISYWEVAKRLNVSDQVMNKWKNDKSLPNGINALKLAEMAKVTPSEAIKLMQGGFVEVSLLAVTSLVAIALAYWNVISSILYIMLNYNYK